VIMAAIGAPDPRQVDGLGGGDMLLSKVCVVSQSSRPDADVECEFANITPGKDRPSYGTNCGNLVAAVAIFAVDEGLVSLDDESLTVRIRNRNSGGVIAAHIEPVGTDTRDVVYLSGMTESGTTVQLDFIDPVGTVQGELLPTGNARDSVRMPDSTMVDVSIVDAGAMYVFVRAVDLGLSAVESGKQMQSLTASMEALEYIRATAAKMLGLIDDISEAIRVTPDVPKLAFVGPAASYHVDGETCRVDANSVDLVSRIVSSQKYHNAYAVTAAIATAAAASVNGSTVHEAIGYDLDRGLQRIRIGHPTGVMECAVEIGELSENPTIPRARITRTARRIMEGIVFIPACSTGKTY
jgi:2-methylaconitate cis-trans-isomerase PrpF